MLEMRKLFILCDLTRRQKSGMRAWAGACLLPPHRFSSAGMALVVLVHVACCFLDLMYLSRRVRAAIFLPLRALGTQRGPSGSQSKVNSAQLLSMRSLFIQNYP
ncbi:hypothetical protein JAAARDRAFT_510939 [Jaapia argillacea MUCL 33604]|uniref:Uncharacterized protein n=1 Tax=Jaapia argillacea MUCL 33604 TaxID=933084 RepID=A0A067Q3C3_9AGAM|nr:hypothetical protein JAAARDRAFT_510939 [Jaapia argillacea MUCL 33604]